MVHGNEGKFSMLIHGRRSQRTTTRRSRIGQCRRRYIVRTALRTYANICWWGLWVKHTMHLWSKKYGFWQKVSSWETSERLYEYNCPRIMKQTITTHFHLKKGFHIQYFSELLFIRFRPNQYNVNYLCDNKITVITTSHEQAVKWVNVCFTVKM
jgi:hypothetical protein